MRLDDNVPVIVEKRVSVRWGSHVCQPRLMMKNEDAPHLFCISRLAPDKEAGVHKLRTGMGKKDGFTATHDHLWMRPLYFGSKVVSSIDSETFCPRRRPAL